MANKIGLIMEPRGVLPEICANKDRLIVKTNLYFTKEMLIITNLNVYRYQLLLSNKVENYI